MAIDDKAFEAAITAFDENSTVDFEAKAVRAAIEAYERALWRPISEAVDGSYILAYWPPHTPIEDKGRIEYGRWCEGELWDGLGNDSNGFTHFRHLPEFPEEVL